MDVLLTPSICINVSTNPAYDRDSAQDNPAVCLFPKNEGSFWVGSGLGIHTNDESSDRSSSIGTREKSGDGDEDEDDDASSKSDETHSSSGLGSLGSLEESLPVKRGLSNHFSGKSKSFVNLTEASSVSDLPKTENPLNKRRRMLIASKWSRRSSFYGWSNNPISMPLLALDEDERKADQSSSDERKADQSSSDEKEPEEEEDDDDDDDNKQENNGLSQKLSKLHQSKRRRSCKSKSCFSLADL